MGRGTYLDSPSLSCINSHKGLIIEQMQVGIHDENRLADGHIILPLCGKVVGVKGNRNRLAILVCHAENDWLALADTVDLAEETPVLLGLVSVLGLGTWLVVIPVEEGIRGQVFPLGKGSLVAEAFEVGRHGG